MITEPKQLEHDLAADTTLRTGTSRDWVLIVGLGSAALTTVLVLIAWASWLWDSTWCELIHVYSKWFELTPKQRPKADRDRSCA